MLILRLLALFETAQKMEFSIKVFFSKCDEIRSFLRILSHLLKKSLMENFIFVQCDTANWSHLKMCKIRVDMIMTSFFKAYVSIYFYVFALRPWNQISS